MSTRRTTAGDIWPAMSISWLPRGPRRKIAMGQLSELSVCRLTCETTMTGIHEAGGLGPGMGTYCGFGQVGADFWPVVPTGNGRPDRHRIDTRYVLCGSLGLNDTFQALLGAASKVPAHSCRSRMLRESQQEAEARILVQNALLDEASRKKLSAELEAECRQICRERSKRPSSIAPSTSETTAGIRAAVQPGAMGRDRAALRRRRESGQALR